METTGKNKMVSNEPAPITKGDLRKSWWLWWFNLETAHSFERMQGLGFCISHIHILKKLYPKKEDLSQALKRHLQFFNTNGIWGAVVPGISIAMEEKKAQGEDIPEEAIVGTKTGLMGAIAGVGDTIDWGMWLPIILSLFIPFAQEGNGIAGILPWILFAAITVAEGYTIFNLGHRAGENSVSQILQGGKIKQLITGASVLGLFMMGGLAASYISVSTPLVITAGMKTLSVQTDILDNIVPGLLPLLTVTGVYLYLEKIKRNFTYAMFILIIAGIVLGGLGILG